MAGDTPPPWFTERTPTSILALLSTVLAALIVLPYLQYVLLAVVLAYVLYPLQSQLERIVSSMTAAITLVVVAILLILLPIAYILAVAIQQGLELLAAVQEGDLQVGTIEQRLETAGVSIDIGDLYGTYEEPIATGLQGVATGALDIIGGIPSVLIGLTVTLFVLFALLRDGGRFVAWLTVVVPVRDDLQDELLHKLDRLMWASVVGNVAVAGVQAVFLGIGLAVLGVPGVAFLTVVTFLFALLPLVGAFGVWLPLSLYLLAIGRPLAAVGLVAYGSLVSASDAYLRPALIGHSGELNAAIVVVGIFGGLVLFGAVGLFVGPVVLGGAKVTLDLYAREQTPMPAEETVQTELDSNSTQ